MLMLCALGALHFGLQQWRGRGCSVFVITAETLFLFLLPFFYPRRCVIFTPNTFCATVSVYMLCASSRARHCAPAPFHYCFHLHPFAAELLSELKTVVLATASRRRIFLINSLHPYLTPPPTHQNSAFIWITDKRDTRTHPPCPCLIRRRNYLRN